MTLIKGVETTKEYFSRKLMDACCAILEIQYDSKKISIIFSDKCGADYTFYWSDKEARQEQGKVNEFIKMVYCAVPVCLSVVPNSPYTEAELGSMAQAIVDLTTDSIHRFEQDLRPSVYQLALAQIRRAAE
jgi:hypothetical protein